MSQNGRQDHAPFFTQQQETDTQLVQQFERKLQVLRDRVASVAYGYHVAAYVVGRPGSSKTFTIRQELDRYDRPWVYHNARMTPMGLFSFLTEHPEQIVVLDDIASLFKNEQALQILLAALDGEPGTARTVTYKSKDREEKIQFSGAIIAISNIPLRCDPLARALGSRIVMLEHEPTDEQIAAFMRLLASRGFEDLTPEECLEVTEFLINETREFDERLDLRHLTKAWQDFRLVKHGKAETSWQDLVKTSLKKVSRLNVPLSKTERIEMDREKVRKAMERFPDDCKKQIEFSGLKSSTFYVRKAEVQREVESAA